VIVLSETDLTGAAAVTERIRAVIAGRPISSKAGAFPATVSAGYSAVDAPTELARFGAEDLRRTAEVQLALAIRGGRRSKCGIGDFTYSLP
jgi:GGDEF domain-containing protein